MNYERVPGYKMSYVDRLREEAWAIAKTRRACENTGRKWQAWDLNMVSVSVADILSGKKRELEIDIPDEEDYKYARERVDSRIELSRRSFARLKKAKTVYVPIWQEQKYVTPGRTSLNSSWNGERNPLSVAEFFFLADIAEEGLKTIFKLDYEGGFAEDGRQKLSDFIGRTTAFVQIRNTRWGLHQWDLNSREIFVPSMKGEVGI